MPETTKFKHGDETWHELREKALNDLWWFNKTALGHGPIPMRERVQLPMLLFADRKTGIPEIDSARVQRILVPREYGKSKCITLARSVRNILRNPNHTIGIANETMLMAKGFLGEIKTVFETNELVRTLFPEVIPPNFHDTIWAADQIVVNRTVRRKEPTVLAAGVDRAVTGVHMTEWVLDDIMSTEAADNARSGSFTEIEKIKRWMNRLEPLCDGPDTPITIIGTPWWSGDCYDYAAELWGKNESAEEIQWPVRLSNGQIYYYHLEIQGDVATFKLPLIVNGEITFPEKWPEHRWAPIQQKDVELFAANFMLDPASDIARDFKDEWLRWYEWSIPNRQIRYRQRDGEIRHVMVSELDTVMGIDPALSETVRGDRTGVVVSGSIDGIHHLILEARGEKSGQVLDLCNTIEELSRRYKCRRIYVEAIAYQKVLSQLLSHKGLPIYEVRPGSQKTKEMRIRGLEPYFRQGHVYLDRTQADFLQEYRQFPRSRHDDILDAMNYLTDEWSRIIGRKPSYAQDRQRADQRAVAQLREWAEGRAGRQNKGASNRVGSSFEDR